MKSIIIAAATFAASVAATGSAVVVNNCDAEVYIHDVPAADGGGTEDDATLSANGGQYSTTYKTLTNGCGWSIKMSNSSAFIDGDVFQFEYTWTGDDVVWFDQSEINGNPWVGNWGISSSDSTCEPSIANYFAPGETEDPTGMQPSCDSSASVTLTLCSSSGSSSSSSSSSSVSSSVASSTYVAPTTSEAASTTSAPVSTTEAAPSTTEAATSTTEAPSTSSEASSTTAAHSWKGHSYNDYAAAVATTASSTASPTTFATAVVTSASAAVSVDDSGDVVVTYTEVATAYATVVETVGAKKRDVHHHQHHAPRHPHGGRA